MDSAKNTLLDLENDDGSIIIGGPALSELFDGVQYGFDERVRIDAAVRQHGIEPVRPERLSVVVECLGDTIGIEDDLIARDELDGLLGEFESFTDAERNALGLVEDEH